MYIIEGKNLPENIIIKEDKALLKLNPRIYHPDVVRSSAYILMDKADIFLDEDAVGNITAEIIPKEGQQVKQLVEQFNQELLNYSVYKAHSEKNKDLREAILKRVLLTNEVLSAVEELKKEMKDEQEIFKSWEEKNPGPD